MSSARGDRKPCTHSGCEGTMQFSKYARPTEVEVRAAGETHPVVRVIGDAPGWICDAAARHFEGITVVADQRA